MQGMLSLGAALLDAAHVLAVDIDSGALDLCLANCQDQECTAVRFPGLLKDSVARNLTVALVQPDLLHASVQSLARMPRLRAHTVVMNPPFGTRVKGADLEFLHAALQVWRIVSASQHVSRLAD